MRNTIVDKVRFCYVPPWPLSVTAFCSQKIYADQDDKQKKSHSFTYSKFCGEFDVLYTIFASQFSLRSTRFCTTAHLTLSNRSHYLTELLPIDQHNYTRQIHEYRAQAHARNLNLSCSSLCFHATRTLTGMQILSRSARHPSS